jgi:hypothetical protein
MKKIPLSNYEASIGCQVTDIDLNSDEEIIELGKTIAENAIVLVDQNITLHRRPTNVTSGSKRNMARVISYHNHIYPNDVPGQTFYTERGKLTVDELMAMVDNRVKEEYNIDLTVS